MKWFWILLATIFGSALGLAQGSVLGKLGQATESTRIYASRSSKAHVFYHVKPYQYLVIQSTDNSHWYRVLLQNGAYGYVTAAKVAVLPYNVTRGKGKMKATAANSRQRYGSMVASRGATSRSGAVGSEVVNESVNYIGTPYVWGGDDIRNGIDCSGFVKKLFGNVGVSLPRTASEQALVGQPIRRLEELQAGDRLYFWERKRGKIGHTGIYMGGGYFIHSSHGRGGVATDYLGSPKWLRILVAARR